MSRQAAEVNVKYTTILPRDGLNELRAMVQQVRTVSHTRLLPPVGSLCNDDLRESICETIRLYFEV